MGNVCGKGEDTGSIEHRFAKPGRTLDSANNPRTATVPKNILAARGAPHSAAATAAGDQDSARMRAAQAAEARAAAVDKIPQGKLASQLHQQKKQSRAAILDGISKNELNSRALDKSLEAQKHL